jgi:hypothetical protein
MFNHLKFLKSRTDSVEEDHPRIREEIENTIATIVAGGYSAWMDTMRTMRDDKVVRESGGLGLLHHMASAFPHVVKFTVYMEHIERHAFLKKEVIDWCQHDPIAFALWHEYRQYALGDVLRISKKNSLSTWSAQNNLKYANEDRHSALYAYSQVMGIDLNNALRNRGWITLLQSAEVKPIEMLPLSAEFSVEPNP